MQACRVEPTTCATASRSHRRLRRLHAFYVVQPDDPILQVWMRLYPTLFTRLDQAPPGLIAHFRYPEDLLNSQAALLATYT